MRGTTLQTSRSLKKWGEEVLHTLKQIPLQPMVKTMVRQAIALKPVDIKGGANIYLQPMEGTYQFRWIYPKEAVNP